MSRARPLLAWLEDKSDWLSPLVVKEVRQVVRGREFMLSFGGSLLAGLAVAFLGAVDALSGSNSAGPWTFVALMLCLTFLGLAVVPLGAFSALRNERMEQTLDLITLTSLSTRRIVIGKLLAQTVKLATFFAAMAPFITMSFLLGGIDFLTILLSLLVLFMMSLWTGALCLFLSTCVKSRAMSGLIFGAVGLMVIALLGTGSSLLIVASRGLLIGGPFGGPGGGPSMWQVFAIGTTVWFTTLVNLILLAENRLSLSTEDSVTPLRLGFFAQFLLLVAWTLSCLNDPALYETAGEVLAIFGSWHLALVACFVVSEEMAIPRRVQRRMTSASGFRRLLAVFGPGPGRGAAYVLAQMALMLGALALLRPATTLLGWMVAALGYICFFTGVPSLLVRRWLPKHATPVKLRAIALVIVALSMVLPDILYYVVARPETLELTFSARHLINPLVTLANWRVVEAQGWWPVPFGIGVAGLLAYLAMIQLSARASGQTVPLAPRRPAPVAEDTGRGDVLY